MREEPTGAARGEPARIQLLVMAGRIGPGDDDRGHLERQKLRERRAPGPRHRDIGRPHQPTDRGGVLENPDLRSGVPAHSGSQALRIPAGDDGQLDVAADEVTALAEQLVMDDLGAVRAAEREGDGATRVESTSPFRLLARQSAGCQNRRAQRQSGHDGLRGTQPVGRLLIGEQHTVHPGRQQPVDEAGNDVLLMDHGGYAPRDPPGERCERGVTPGAEDQAGTKAPHDRTRLDYPDRVLSQRECGRQGEAALNSAGPYLEEPHLRIPGQEAGLQTPPCAHISDVERITIAAMERFDHGEDGIEMPPRPASGDQDVQYPLLSSSFGYLGHIARCSREFRSS